MPRNEALREALIVAGLTVGDLAAKCDVDAKTVERWISRGRIPHPRSRVRVAQVLGKDVGVLWPEVVRRAVKVGSDRELVGVYARRSDLPRTLFRELIEHAESRLWFGGYTSYFVWLEVPKAAAMLGTKARDGADVRFLLGDPASPVTTGRERVEATPLTLATRIAMSQAEIAKSPTVLPVRMSDRHIAMSVWVFDDEAIVATHIGAGLGQDSVTLHLRRREAGGPFDRYVEHFEALWADAQPAQPEQA
ncbi:helix-turn-helix domain-containing protein [Micromonospora sp. NBC_01655]|uniref:helix-turn-helix domain-containing protein n=1 Tax=Micromonospora sp. NBC_01655 TaxID=2975983 RepID=UPI00224CF619|nr:helix-turn-helix transcriptional regulator [Micromonospora sp. NBC_01655]MCX4469258.1 helix-turn-helix domain-containing protein [Micromonospora sp. NBC_01655]